MAPRAAVHSLLSDDSELAALGVERVYAANAIDTPAEDCFVVIRWDNATAAFKKVGSDSCSIWVHDRNRDYSRINDALNRIRDLLSDAVHLEGDDGITLTLAEWRGEGPDLVDDGYRTVTRFSDFTVVSRYTTT